MLLYNQQKYQWWQTNAMLSNTEPPPFPIFIFCPHIDDDDRKQNEYELEREKTRPFQTLTHSKCDINLPENLWPYGSPPPSKMRSVWRERKDRVKIWVRLKKGERYIFSSGSSSRREKSRANNSPCSVLKRRMKGSVGAGYIFPLIFCLCARIWRRDDDDLAFW